MFTSYVAPISGHIPHGCVSVTGYRLPAPKFWQTLRRPISSSEVQADRERDRGREELPLAVHGWVSGIGNLVMLAADDLTGHRPIPVLPAPPDAQAADVQVRVGN